MRRGFARVRPGQEYPALSKDESARWLQYPVEETPGDQKYFVEYYSEEGIIISKGETIKAVLDARHLNSNAYQSFEL